ncbi:MAG: 50S ribosomal protein L4 [Luteitalea sp.]|nr:50S ribosomal protein L4 [Luteitalea sp.]
MTIDVVNTKNEKVGSLELRDEVFGGRVRPDLIWEAVVHAQAEQRRGTHKTKERGEVRGSGRKLWRQKGTGRARVSDLRTPIWRKGGTIFGPRPRDYGYALPKKVRRGALRDAFTQKLRDGAVVVVEALGVDEVKTKLAAAMLKTLGATAKTLLIDVAPESTLVLSTRNLVGVRLVPANRVSARDVMDATTVIATRAALERLQTALA